MVTLDAQKEKKHCWREEEASKEESGPRHAPPQDTFTASSSQEADPEAYVSGKCFYAKVM